jgi:phosphonate transport system substrate-binding protein
LNCIRVYTDLVPDIPLPFFEGLVDYLGSALSVPVSLHVGRSAENGHDVPDPFSSGQADIGFLRSPCFLDWWGRRQAVTVLPVAPVFRDPRAQGQPVYYAEVVVRGSHPAQSFWDLRGCIWGYSSPDSLSSHVSVLKKLGELGEDERFFRSHQCSGSHRDSLRLLRAGEVDAVAVDSNVLILARRRNPELRHDLRIVESWGPLPIQPVVASPALAPEMQQQIVRHLCRMGDLPVGRELLDDLWMSGFASTEATPYQELQRAHFGLDKDGEAPVATVRGNGNNGKGPASRLRYFLNSLF